MQQRCKCVCSCPMAASPWVGSPQTTATLHLSYCHYYCAATRCCCGGWGTAAGVAASPIAAPVHRNLQTGQILLGDGYGGAYLGLQAMKPGCSTTENAGASETPPRPERNPDSGRSRENTSLQRDGESRYLHDGPFSAHPASTLEAQAPRWCKKGQSSVAT